MKAKQGYKKADTFFTIRPVEKTPDDLSALIGAQVSDGWSYVRLDQGCLQKAVNVQQ